MTANVQKVAYVEDRGLPWWTDGTDDRGAALAGLATSAEMAVATGLDTPVTKEPIFLADGTTRDDKFATVRAGEWLGVVGKTYSVIQDVDAFSFGDNLVDDGQAKWETAGSLRGGCVTFMSMELNHLDLTLDGEHADGIVKTYLLLSNAHDGSRALEVDITKVRVVCQNTLNLAIAGAQRRFKIRHSGSIDGKIAAARQALGIAFTYDKAFAATAERLLSKKLVDAQVQEIFRTAVWPIDVETATEGRIESHPSTLAFETYLKAEDLAPIRGTAWGALNAVADFIDHGQEYRGRKDNAADVRANSILWGTGQAKKQAAYKALLKV